MRLQYPKQLRGSRLRPLAACLAVAFAGETLATPNPDRPEIVLLVQNCDDSGANSLRDIVDVANSLSGDVTIQFDLNAMQCSTITLTSGEIKITQDNVTLQGPGADQLTIDGGYSEGHYNRIFKHTGQGTLTIEGLSLADAKYVGNTSFMSGGCVYGNTVKLFGSKVSNCQVSASSADVHGGGVFARRSLGLYESSVSNCHAISAGSVQGGGAYAGNLAQSTITTRYSVVENNTAYSTGNATGSGGGIFTKSGVQTAQINGTTISGNRSDEAGGLYIQHNLVLVDSTVSGNQARVDAGAEVNEAAVLYNSTVAFNKATEIGRTAGVYGASVQSNSSILAFNFTDYGNGPTETDVKSADGMVVGANNLIMAAVSGTTLPNGTSTACPRLAPLLANGGPTRTHALLPGSPAIDFGNNVGDLDTDQRGPGFDRVVGAFADIGAYEFGAGQGDVINSSGFENCE